MPTLSQTTILDIIIDPFFMPTLSYSSPLLQLCLDYVPRNICAKNTFCEFPPPPPATAQLTTPPPTTQFICMIRLANPRFTPFLLPPFSHLPSFTSSLSVPSLCTAQYSTVYVVLFFLFFLYPLYTQYSTVYVVLFPSSFCTLSMHSTVQYMSSCSFCTLSIHRTVQYMSSCSFCSSFYLAKNCIYFSI